MVQNLLTREKLRRVVGRVAVGKRHRNQGKVLLETREEMKDSQQSGGLNVDGSKLPSPKKEKKSKKVQW